MLVWASLHAASSNGWKVKYRTCPLTRGRYDTHLLVESVLKWFLASSPLRYFFSFFPPPPPHLLPSLIAQNGIQYPGQAFKVATISEWVVMLSGKQHMEDTRKAPEDVVSFKQAIVEVIIRQSHWLFFNWGISKVTQKQYTLGLSLDDDSYHTTTVRSPLTRNVAGRFEDNRDEIVESFKEFVPLTEGEIHTRRGCSDMLTRLSELLPQFQIGHLSLHTTLFCTSCAALVTDICWTPLL